MSCCCVNVYDFCNQNVCGSGLFKPLNLVALKTGDYVLSLDFMGIILNIKSTLTVGDPLSFDITGLNESFTYKGIILDPDNEQVEFTSGDVIYDCVMFQTKINYTVN